MNKEDSSLSFRLVRSPKVEIFAEIFRANLQSLVWCRHVGVPLWDTNMAAGNSVNIWNLLWLSRTLINCTEQTSI